MEEGSKVQVDAAENLTFIVSMGQAPKALDPTIPKMQFSSFCC